MNCGSVCGVLVSIVSSWFMKLLLLKCSSVGELLMGVVMKFDLFI